MPGPTKAQVLSYIQGLNALPSRRVLIGQHLGTLVVYGGRGLRGQYEDYFLALQTATGRMPAMCNFSTRRWDPQFTAAEIAELSYRCIAWWNSGGLVQIHHTPTNPWTGGSSNDTTRAAWALEDLVDPVEAVYATWHTELSTLAGQLQVLADHDVVMIVRPLLEIPGSWFWWGPQGTEWTDDQARFEASYEAAFQDFHDYLGTTHGLADNIIWAYTTSNRLGRNLAACYPGDSYVDIAGGSLYDDSALWNSPGYTELNGLGKPLLYAEHGPTYPNTGDYSNMDTPNAIRAAATNVIGAVWWGTWAEDSQEAIIDNPDADEMMNDPWMIPVGMVEPNFMVCGMHFENNDTDAFDSETDTHNDMAVGAPGLNSTSYKLELTIDDTTPAYGSRYIHVYYDRLRWQFYLDPNGCTIPAGEEIVLHRVGLSASPNVLVDTILTYADSSYGLMVRFYEDDASTTDTSVFAISDAEHDIEVLLVRASNDTNGDGWAAVQVDGVEVLGAATPRLDNYDAWDLITDVDFGAVSVSNASVSGTVYVDQLYMNRSGDPIEYTPPAAAGGYVNLSGVVHLSGTIVVS